MVRRVVLIGGGVLALWLALLTVLGFALGSRQERKTRERLADSLQAQVALGDVDLALVRGRMTIDQLSIKRDDAVGHMAIHVNGVRCELAPLGIALFDHDCHELIIRGVRFEVSTAALFRMQRPPKGKPIRTDHLVIDDAVLVFLPSAFLPDLGKVTIAIEHADSAATVMRTPLSWLFSLRELTARFDLPAGISVRVTYRDGMLTASGSLFGSGAIELPVQLPVGDTARDAHDEMQLLIKLGKQIAERLVAKRAEDWLRSKLSP